MQGGQSARARRCGVRVAVAALVVVSLALAGGASALDSFLTVDAGKKPGGPFNQNNAAVTVTKARSFYFRVRNTAPARMSVELFDRSTVPVGANVGDYSIRWFKGEHEISGPMFAGGGYSFHLASNGKKVFRALVKPRNSHRGPLCLEVQAQQQPSGAQAFGYLRVNGGACGA